MEQGVQDDQDEDGRSAFSSSTSSCASCSTLHRPGRLQASGCKRQQEAERKKTKGKNKRIGLRFLSFFRQCSIITGYPRHRRPCAQWYEDNAVGAAPRGRPRAGTGACPYRIGLNLTPLGLAPAERLSVARTRSAPVFLSPPPLSLHKLGEGERGRGGAPRTLATDHGGCGRRTPPG